MADKLRLNVQTRVGDNLLGIGTYDLSTISKSAIKEIEEYCKTQKSLPLEKRDVPPYFEIIKESSDSATNQDANGSSNKNTNNEPKSDANDGVDKYINLSNKELRDLCKQRGIETKQLKSNKDFIQALVDNDKEEVDEWDNQFKSPDAFSEMSSDNQIEYLDDIFGLPEDIDEDSDEAIKYSDDLVVAVNAYAGLSLDAEVIEKVKEIISYYEED